MKWGETGSVYGIELYSTSETCYLCLSELQNLFSKKGCDFFKIISIML